MGGNACTRLHGKCGIKSIVTLHMTLQGKPHLLCDVLLDLVKLDLEQINDFRIFRGFGSSLFVLPAFLQKYVAAFRRQDDRGNQGSTGYSGCCHLGAIKVSFLGIGQYP